MNPNPCPVDYTAVFLAAIAVLGNLLQLYLNLKYKDEIKALKSSD
jgi:hypothetical protein